ncbi:glycosyltransferase [Mechercharimyces sp. CAU 1602]|uniref:glycosyltransferase n=1 Tax=Mechercharimyces sp. CAU 1602 TaxID=2973933 RepID=UPI002162B4F5|nr:glycosyltransferase [Mechercharimyces sp. CAU 1602]MCS1352010.1 glycosyltransferase [Mechercharimyces sp. CAU 1602]
MSKMPHDMMIGAYPIQEQLIFSFLLVVRNEEAHINFLLESILNQDFPNSKYEIIVVDGESTDATQEIIRKYVKKFPNRIQYLINPKRTLATGWNLGIRAAQGEYVIRVDGHSQIPQDFLSKTYQVAERVPEAACVGGIIESVGTGFWGKVNAYVYSHPFGVGNSKFRTAKSGWEGYVDTVPYAAYRRDIFTQVGYFDEDLQRNEDLEMHARIRNTGKGFYLSTGIRSTYYVRNTIRSFLKKSYGDGKWTMIARKRGAGVLRFRHLVPLLALIIGAFLLVASFFSTVATVALTTIIFLYAALLMGSAVGVIKQIGVKYLLPCMLSFFLLHTSRGVGSLVGLIKSLSWSESK